jgi:predicted dienelactone hydrolase
MWAALAATALVAGCSSSNGSDGAPAPTSIVEPGPDATPQVTSATSPPPDPTAPTTDAPPLPDASPGPFAVGHTTLVVPADATGQELMVDVWYPSDGSPGTKARYDLVAGVRIDGRLAEADVPPAPGSFPLVVYSHGSGGFRFVATYFTEVLASHGYVVAAVDHPGDTIIDAAIRLSSGESLDLAAAVRRRYDDLRRVIDGVTSASAAASSDTNRVPFAGSVDPDRIVLAGHSLGGAGAVGAAAADPRVDAVIAMDATWGILTPEELAEVRVPVLIMYGMAGQAPGSREIEAGTAAPWYRTDLTRASHVGFTDACSYQALVPGWMAAGAPAEVEAYVAELTAADCGPSVLPSDRLHDLVDGYSLAFLARYLDGDPAWDATLMQPRPDVEVDHNP